MKNIILMILGFFLLTSFASAHVGDDFGHHMMEGMMTGMMGSGNMMTGYSVTDYRTFNWIFNILLIFIAILVIILLTKQIQKK